ncbi:MAG: AraC family transcriptional regulator [Pseudomonadales bacterium]|nr:AraC family transcriptional regulator [Pseudomonadales bacterium]
MLINPNESILAVHHYPRALVEFMEKQGVDRTDLLEGTQIDPRVFEHRESTISYAQYGALIFNAMRYFPNDRFGLEFGRALYITQHGMLGVAVMSSATLLDAIRVMERYYQLLSPIVTLSLQTEDRDCVIKADLAWNIGPLRAMAMETFFVGLYGNCESIVGEIIPAAFFFQHSKPTYGDAYFDYFGDQCHFDCATDQIVFDPKWLRQPLKWANETTCYQAKQICDVQLQKIAEQESLLGKLRAIPLVKSGKVLALDEAAEHLHMSGRSLRRHLSLLNTSYQQVADKVRAELAESLFRNGEYSVSQVAEELGFSDVANFRKAFKRWFGKTPSEYRRRLQS